MASIPTAGNDSIMGTAAAETISALAGNDIIRGGDGNDTIHGNGGNDKLYGDGGNDDLWGDGGNDDIGGGAGIDYAHYTGTQAQYKISTTDGVTEVKDLRGNGSNTPDGIDHLTSVEYLAFGDGTFLRIGSTSDHYFNADVSGVVQNGETVVGGPGNDFYSINPFHNSDFGPYGDFQQQAIFETNASSFGALPTSVAAAKVIIDSFTYYSPPEHVDVYVYSGDGQITPADWDEGTLAASVVLTAGSAPGPLEIDLDVTALDAILATHPTWLGLNFRMHGDEDPGIDNGIAVAPSAMHLDLVF